MAKVPLPERGQPLDLTFLYRMAEAINDLSTQVSSATYKYATVDTFSAGPQNVKTSDLRVVAGYQEVYNNATVTAASEKPFSYTFPADFKYAPIVTASVVNIGNTSSGKDTTVVLTSITTSRVDGVLKFRSGGDLSVGVNLIIVGIPN
jgi:hypothetical protein